MQSYRITDPSLFVCLRDISKSYEAISMTLGGQVGHDAGKSLLHVGAGQPDGGALICSLMFWPITFEL